MVTVAIPVTLQQSILSLLLFDDEHVRLIRNSLNTETWASDAGVSALVKSAYAFFDTYGQALGPLHVYDAISELPLSSSAKDNLVQLVSFCEGSVKEINIPFMLTKIETFHRQSLWKSVIPELLVLTEAGKFDELESLALETSKRRLQVFDPGSHLSDTINRLLLRDDSQIEKDRVLLGIPALDERGVVPGRRQLFVLAAAAKKGKCLGKGTQVIKYDGSLINVEDIRVGDILLGPDSTSRTVLTLGRGRDQMYKVIPKRGEPFVCNASHILSLKTSGLRIQGGTKHHGAHSTGDRVEMTVDQYLKLPKGDTHCLKLWHPSGVTFAVNKALFIDPYLLGLWLGDGTSSLMGITTMDQEIVAYLEQTAEKLHLGISVSLKKGASNRAKVYRFVEHKRFFGRNRPSWLYNLFESYGLINNKHIPMIYKVSSREDRLLLLAGLLDSDGYLNEFRLTSANYEITQKSVVLANDIAYLARSLGFSVTMTAVRKYCTYKGERREGTYYKLLICGHLDQVPVRLPRKKATPRHFSKDILATGFTVEPLGEDDYYGFTLDGDGLFLLQDFTVSHNSFFVIHIGKQALIQGKKVLHITLEMDEDETNTRYLQTIFGMKQKQGDVAKDFNRVSITPGGYDVGPIPPSKEMSHEALFEALDRLKSEKYLDEHLLVKSFPSGSLTINQLKAFMDNLELQQNFVPDILLIDYADLFDLSSEYQREELNKIYVQLKGMASERNIAVVTVSQINREGAKNKRADSRDVAEAWGKIATCDKFLVYNQTDLEHELNIGRIFVSDSRGTESKFEVVITQDYSTSNFCLTSQYMDTSWKAKHKEFIKKYSGED